MENDYRYADYIREECTNDEDGYERAVEILLELLTDNGYHKTVQTFREIEAKSA